MFGPSVLGFEASSCLVCACFVQFFFLVFRGSFWPKTLEFRCHKGLKLVSAHQPMCHLLLDLESPFYGHALVLSRQWQLQSAIGSSTTKLACLLSEQLAYTAILGTELKEKKEFSCSASSRSLVNMALPIPPKRMAAPLPEAW